MWSFKPGFHSPLSPSSRGSLVPLQFLPLEWYHRVSEVGVSPANVDSSLGQTGFCSSSKSLGAVTLPASRDRTLGSQGLGSKEVPGPPSRLSQSSWASVWPCLGLSLQLKRSWSGGARSSRASSLGIPRGPRAEPRHPGNRPLPLLGQFWCCGITVRII